MITVNEVAVSKRAVVEVVPTEDVVVPSPSLLGGSWIITLVHPDRHKTAPTTSATANTNITERLRVHRLVPIAGRKSTLMHLTPSHKLVLDQLRLH
ncbi:MAG: hypothetical protein BWY79_01442 [Actinobacteria bacterium ADurb.Bin444]|nr:MAG: hypothetical protein BWY79_01442 [Actinobacteria bacterium ADurb.Bin444]